jgi:hypothetical protein
MTQEFIKISFASNTDRDKIYQLRHEVFGTDLIQHSVNESRILRNKLDGFNTYITAKIDNQIVGFISVTSPDENNYSIDKEKNSIPKLS